jgi:hypothetical protein
MLVALRVVLYCTATKEKFENTEEGVRSLKPKKGDNPMAKGKTMTQKTNKRLSNTEKT